ncbi:ABC transporter substrate-binding protein [Rubellimicrobium arenae]|uniref:ABC transporter substrate-binding protein n=1 Tax=Rubellimicrobium arenae TaxID=2817372 RepID=UPI001B3057D8|nr:ABC transporter substrate-binding protein [Rubellimicrobium arenae]
MTRTLLLSAATLALAAAAQAEPIRMGLQPWLGYGPLWVAAEKGFFQQEGLEVELTTFNWDQDMTAALASESLDVSVAATNSVITYFNQGLDVKGFLILDVSNEADAVLAGADVGGIADLKGRTVAFESGTTSDLLINYALKEAGMSLADIQHVPMGASEAGLALISGQVDAAVTYEPYISAALSQGEGHKVIYTAAEEPGLISDMMVATGTWIDAHPEEVQGLIRAWDDAVAFIRENPEEGSAIIAEAVGSPMEEFAPAFAGVRLYSVAENRDALTGQFQETVTQIGTVMQATNPDEVRQVPTADQIMSLDGLNAVAGQ